MYYIKFKQNYCDAKREWFIFLLYFQNLNLDKVRIYYEECYSLDKQTIQRIQWYLEASQNFIHFPSISLCDDQETSVIVLYKRPFFRLTLKETQISYGNRFEFILATRPITSVHPLRLTSFQVDRFFCFGHDTRRNDKNERRKEKSTTMQTRLTPLLSPAFFRYRATRPAASA